MTAAADRSVASTRVLRQFRRIFNTVKTHFRQVEKKAGIGGAQVWALSLIAEQPGIGVTGLAQRMDIHQTTASNLVRALATAGLVVAERKGSDRRAVQLRLLPPAERLLRKAPGPLAGVLPAALAELDPPTLQRLEADLDTLLAVLQADEHGGGIPLAPL
ncbi:MAG: MarR family winged helix-turn-helix transcriptional regulator [Proteobacteria bacterium]|nr:MarR family winged helix-turn-helix transcriptional regulator [Pseudomonadota bacterium]